MTQQNDKYMGNLEKDFSQYDPLNTVFQSIRIDETPQAFVTFGSSADEMEKSNPLPVPPSPESSLMKTIRTIREKLTKTVSSLPQMATQKAQQFINNLRQKELQVNVLREQSNDLAQKLDSTIMNKQYQTAFYRLPVVMKKIRSSEHLSPPEGLHYINNKGHKTYLKNYQKRQWEKGQLPGCIEGCDPQTLKT